MSKKRVVILLAIAAGLVMSRADAPKAAAAGGPLVSDDMRTPVHASVLPFSHDQTTTAATMSGEPIPTCSAGVTRTIWYRLRAPATERIVATTAGSSFDTMLQVYVAGANGLVPVTCNDDWEAATSRVEFSATAAKVY